jgi:phage terminase large subunit GpA-like protein
MESLTDQGASDTVLMWAAQMGKTEILLNAIGYFIDAQPSPMLIVYPTLDVARKFSTKKLTRMIEESPRIAGSVSDPRSRDSGNTILSKEFRGGSLVIAGSNSPASLRQLSCRVVIQDEIDTYEPSAGMEGDPCFLADARAMNFHDAVLIKSSTPTIRGASRIEALYDASDQRKWYVPCSECGKHQVLRWAQVQWPEAKPEEAYYVCEHCQAHLTDHQRVQMVQAGEWRAENPAGRTRGYSLSGLYRIMGRKRKFSSYLHEFVVQFLDAKRRGREHLKVWTNTFLNETWEEAGDRIESAVILDRCEDYDTDPLPEEVLVLTAGADVQKDRLEVTVVGWGIAEESWGIEHRTIYGDPEKLEVWKSLDDFLSRKWKHPSGSSLRIACACIDSGYATRSVYGFTKPRQNRRVYSVKGSSRAGAPLVTKRFVKMGRTTVFFVGGDTAKDSIFARLKMEEAEGPRVMHFPFGKGFDEEYFKQLTAEEIRTRMRHGFPVRFYKKLRERNEALDCRVYNMAALEILNPNFERMAKNLKVKDKPVEEKGPLPKNVKQKPPRQQGGGFVDAWR